MILFNKEKKKIYKICSSRYAMSLEGYNNLLNDPGLLFVTRELIRLEGDISTPFGGTYSEIYNKVRRECTPYTRKEIELYFYPGYGDHYIFRQEACNHRTGTSANYVALINNMEDYKTELTYANKIIRKKSLDGFYPDYTKEEFDFDTIGCTTTWDICQTHKQFKGRNDTIDSDYKIYKYICDNYDSYKLSTLRDYWIRTMKILLYVKPSYAEQKKIIDKAKDENLMLVAVVNSLKEPFSEEKYYHIINEHSNKLKSDPEGKESVIEVLNSLTLLRPLATGQRTWAKGETFEFDYTL